MRALLLSLIPSFRCSWRLCNLVQLGGNIPLLIGTSEQDYQIHLRFGANFFLCIETKFISTWTLYSLRPRVRVRVSLPSVPFPLIFDHQNSFAS